ncbi:MAG TPA: MarR family transcriptional regulator [Mycobacteriales bacterium]|jgi:DNA-binding MarR family transcriptional regulator
MSISEQLRDITESMASERSDAPCAGQVGRALSRLFRVAGKAKGQMFHSGGQLEGVDWSAFAVLVPLVESGPQRSSALADAAHVDPSRVSRLVSHLVEIGLIERRADPADGRACILAATDEGVRTCTRLREIRDGFLTELVADWSPQDRTQLAVLLDRLAGELETAVHAADKRGPAALRDTTTSAGTSAATTAATSAAPRPHMETR